MNEVKKPFQIVAVSWSNDLLVHNQFFATSFEAAPWYGWPEIYPIVIVPHDGCKNLGEAYNLGRQRAQEILGHKPDVYIYMHQDVQLQDRSLGNKLRVMLSPSSGIGAVGPMGATIDTGSGYWFCHPKYQTGHTPDLNPKNLVILSDARPLKVLDGIFLATNQDIEWSEEYEAVHMFIEDYCMRIRAKGLQIFGVDTWLLHKGSGRSLDSAFWRSAHKFFGNWQHAFDNDVPPLELFEAFIGQYHLDGGLVHRKILNAGLYDVVWQTWAKKRAEDKRVERKKEKELARA